MATDEAIRVHYKGQLQMRMESQAWPPSPKQQAFAIENLLSEM
jgi:hypothetical protein